MIKFFIIICIVFAIMGDAIRFSDSDGNFGIIINKKQVLYGIQDGAIKAYNISFDYLKTTGVINKIKNSLSNTINSDNSKNNN